MQHIQIKTELKAKDFPKPLYEKGDEVVIHVICDPEFFIIQEIVISGDYICYGVHSVDGNYEDLIVGESDIVGKFIRRKK